MQAREGGGGRGHGRLPDDRWLVVGFFSEGQRPLAGAVAPRANRRVVAGGGRKITRTHVGKKRREVYDRDFVFKFRRDDRIAFVRDDRGPLRIAGQESLACPWIGQI